MAESYIGLPADGSGKKLRTFQQVVGANTVEHQALVICDSSGNIVGVTSSRLLVDGSGVTQPVSAVSLPLPTGAAADATLTGGTQKSINRGAAKGTTIAGDVTSEAVDANTQAMHVNLKGTQASVPVTGTFFQATQPVSLATAPTTPVTGTFWQATQPVSGPLTDTQLRATAVPVSGTFFQATQPVSLATNTPDVTDRAARILGVVTMAPSTLLVTATGASGATATVTLPAVAGQFHYITAITITAYSAAARTGAATPWLVTTTNLPGSPVWTFSTAAAIGATDTQTLVPVAPLKSSVVNTATTIVAPVATGVIWRVIVSYYTAA